MIEKLAWIQMQEKRILSTRTTGRDTFYLPGGKRERDETDVEALIREIREELTVELEPRSLVFEGEFSAQAHAAPEGVEVKMICYSASYRGELRPSSEIEEFAWLSYRDRPKVSNVDQKIFDWLKAKGRLSD